MEHIYIDRPTLSKRYKVQIKRSGTLYGKRFATLEEAQVYRDQLIQDLPSPKLKGNFNKKSDEEKEQTKREYKDHIHEPIPCTQCGKAITRHHMSRHLKTVHAT